MIFGRAINDANYRRNNREIILSRLKLVTHYCYQEWFILQYQIAFRTSKWVCNIYYHYVGTQYLIFRSFGEITISPIFQSCSELKVYASERPNDVTCGTPKVPYTFDFVFRPFGEIANLQNCTLLKAYASKRPNDVTCGTPEGHIQIIFCFQIVW